MSSIRKLSVSAQRLGLLTWAIAGIAVLVKAWDLMFYIPDAGFIGVLGPSLFLVLAAIGVPAIVVRSPIDGRLTVVVISSAVTIVIAWYLSASFLCRVPDFHGPAVIMGDYESFMMMCIAAVCACAVGSCAAVPLDVLKLHEERAAHDDEDRAHEICGAYIFVMTIVPAWIVNVISSPIRVPLLAIEIAIAIGGFLICLRGSRGGRRRSDWLGRVARGEVEGVRARLLGPGERVLASPLTHYDRSHLIDSVIEQIEHPEVTHAYRPALILRPFAVFASRR